MGRSEINEFYTRKHLFLNKYVVHNLNKNLALHFNPYSLTEEPSIAISFTIFKSQLDKIEEYTMTGRQKVIYGQLPEAAKIMVFNKNKLGLEGFHMEVMDVFKGANPSYECINFIPDLTEDMFNLNITATQEYRRGALYCNVKILTKINSFVKIQSYFKDLI